MSNENKKGKGHGTWHRVEAKPHHDRNENVVTSSRKEVSNRFCNFIIQNTVKPSMIGIHGLLEMQNQKLFHHHA